MGIVAIKSHMNNKTPKKLKSELQKIKDFFNKKAKDIVEPTDKDV